MGEVASLWATLGWKDGEFERGLSKSEKQWGQFEKKIQQTNGPVGSVASSLGFVATPAGAAAAGIAAVGLAATASAQAFIGWDSGLKDIQKTAGESTNVEALSDALLDLSTEKPIDPYQLQQVAAAAGQLGIDGTQNVMAFTETVSDAAVAFNMLPEEAATKLAVLGNLFEGGNVQALDNLGSSINAMGNSLAATEGQIIASMSKMAGLGAQYGMAGSEAAALSGNLIALGMDADSAGTLTNSFMSQLTDPAKWSKAGELIGMTADEFGKLATSDIDESMLQIAEGLEQIADDSERAKAIADLGFSQESAKVLNKMVGHTAEIRESMELANEAYEEGVALQEEANAKFSSTASKIQLIKNDATAIAIEFGGWIVNSETFSGALDGIHSTLGLVRDNMDTITGFASHLGEDLKGAFDNLTPAGLLFGGLGDGDSLIGSTARSWGASLWAGIEAYAGTAGEESGEEFAEGVGEAAGDALPGKIEGVFGSPEMKKAAEEGGEEVAKAFGGAWSDSLIGVLDAGMQPVYAYMRDASGNVVKDAAGYGIITGISGYIGQQLGGKDWKMQTFESGGIEYTYAWETSGNRSDFYLLANGKKIAKIAGVKQLASPEDLLKSAGLSGPVPGSADWYDALSAYLAAADSNTLDEFYGMTSEEASMKAAQIRLEYDIYGPENEEIKAMLAEEEAELQRILDEQAEESKVTAKAQLEWEVEQNEDLVKQLADEAAAPLREALFWEGYEGSETEEGLGEFADDLYALAETAEELGGDFADAYQIITNPWQYEAGTVALAKDYIKSLLPENVDPESVDAIAAYFVRTTKAGTEKAEKDLKSQWAEESEWLPISWVGYFQEHSDMFLDPYMGPTEGWAGPGQGAKPGYEASNYFQYGVEVDLELNPDEANAKIETLEGEIAAEKIAPIDAEIGPALSKLEILKAEIMEPVTKPVYLEVIGPSQGIVQGGADAAGVDSWLSFASGGIAKRPVVIGDAPSPEVFAPLDNLLPMISQAVATAGGNGGGNTYNITVNESVNARETVRLIAREIDKSETRNAQAFAGRFRGG